MRHHTHIPPAPTPTFPGSHGWYSAAGVCGALAALVSLQGPTSQPHPWTARPADLYELSQTPWTEAWHCAEKKFSIIPVLEELMAQVGRRDHFQFKILLFLYLHSEAAEELRRLRTFGFLPYCPHATTQMALPSNTPADIHRWTPFSSPPGAVRFFWSLKKWDYFHLLPFSSPSPGSMKREGT